MTKNISHFLALNDIKSLTKPKLHCMDHFNFVKENVYDKVTKRVTSVLKKVQCGVGNLSHYRVSDFYLENLQASGAIDNLTSSFCSRDSFSALNILSNTAQTIVNNSKTE